MMSQRYRKWSTTSCRAIAWGNRAPTSARIERAREIERQRFADAVGGADGNVSLLCNAEMPALTICVFRLRLWRKDQRWRQDTGRADRLAPAGSRPERGTSVGPAEVREYCRLDDAGKSLLRDAPQSAVRRERRRCYARTQAPMTQLGTSACAFHRTAKRLERHLHHWRRPSRPDGSFVPA